MKIVIKLGIVALFITSLVFLFLARQEDQPYTEAKVNYVKLKENYVAEEDPQTENTSLTKRSIDFEGLQKVNPDIVGWIYIPGTQIDYPICKGDATFYLTHNPQRKFNKLGSIFITNDSSKEFTGANTLIYGHNMASGQMFGELTNYEQRSFLKAHQTIYIYTPSKTVTCKVFSAYTLNSTDSTVYASGYEFDSNNYKMFLENVKANSLHSETEVVESNNQTLTLSTCTDAGSTKKRFIVVCVVK